MVPYPKPSCTPQLLPIKWYVHPRANLVMVSFCCLFVSFVPAKTPWADMILIFCWCNFLCSRKAAPDGCEVGECRTSCYVGWVKFQVLGSQEIYNQGRQKVRNHVLEQEVNILGCIRSHRCFRGLVHEGLGIRDKKWALKSAKHWHSPPIKLNRKLVLRGPCRIINNYFLLWETKWISISLAEHCSPAHSKPFTLWSCQELSMYIPV